MSIEIPVYKAISLPVETQVASLNNNNLSQSSVANFNNLMSMPSAIERSSFDQRLDQNFIQNNNSMLNQIINSISTLDLNIKTSSSNLRQATSKYNNFTERAPDIGGNATKTSLGSTDNNISSLTGEMNNTLEKVKNLYKLQNKFHKSMTLVTLFSSLLTAFKGTMDKFLKM